jgi:diguanylate cyclase (GGDEF)-like protein
VSTGSGKSTHKTASLPSFDSTTSLLGSLDKLPSRITSTGGAFGLGTTVRGLGTVFGSGLPTTTIGSGGLPEANSSLGLTSGATGVNGQTAARASGQRPAGHPGSAVPPYIEVVPNVIDHFVNVIPGVVWIALAASLGLAVAGAGSAVAFRQKANRHAGRFAAVAAAALTDPLTGVLNRRGFTGAVDRELARARRYGRPFVLAYVDVRGLKAVNDTEGHLAGDELLKGVAALLTECARADDVVGRLGGDELGLLLAEQSADVAGTVTHRIEEQVAKRRAALGLSAPWSLTIGTASYPADGESFDELIRVADRRLYEQRGIEIR